MRWRSAAARGAPNGQCQRDAPPGQLPLSAETFGPSTINNAGIGSGPPGAERETSRDGHELRFAVNYLAPYLLTRLLLPLLEASAPSRIVNVASTAGLKGYPYVAAYCAAKHALVGLTRALAAETAKRGVTVNAVCPGYTDTELIRDSVGRVADKSGRAPAEVRAEYERNAPIGRLIDPREVAAAVLYLCSPEAAAVTGTTLAVAGGEL